MQHHLPHAQHFKGAAQVWLVLHLGGNPVVGEVLHPAQHENFLAAARQLGQGGQAGYERTRYVGPFTVQAGVRAATPAIQGFRRETAVYRQGITPEELRFLQASVGQRDALRYETGQQKAQFLSRLLEYDLRPDFVAQQSALLRHLTAADVQATARKYLLDNMYIVVVGDPSSGPPCAPSATRWWSWELTARLPGRFIRPFHLCPRSRRQAKE